MVTLSDPLTVSLGVISSREFPDPQDESPLFCDPTEYPGSTAGLSALVYVLAPSSPSCGPMREEDSGEVSRLSLLPAILASDQTLQEDGALSVHTFVVRVFWGLGYCRIHSRIKSTRRRGGGRRRQQGTCSIDTERGQEAKKKIGN